MKTTSKSLDRWADLFVSLGFTLFVLSILGWAFSGGSVFESLVTSVMFIIASQVLRGLSVLVRNAEEEIETRKKFDL